MTYLVTVIYTLGSKILLRKHISKFNWVCKSKLYSCKSKKTSGSPVNIHTITLMNQNVQYLKINELQVIIKNYLQSVNNLCYTERWLTAKK